MEKRVLLAVSLSFVVLVVYQAFFVPPAPRRAAPAQAPAEKSAGVAPAAPASTPERSAEPQPESPSSSAGSIAVVGDSEERDVIAESQAFRAVFTTRGAELTSWQLKGYFDDQHRIIDIIPRGLPAGQLRPFALVADDDELTARLRQALFKPSATRVDVASGQRRLEFTYEDSTGLKASKTFEFALDGKPYLLSFSARVERGSALVPVALSSGPGLGDTARAVGSSSFLSPSYYQKPEGIFQRGGDVTRLPAAQIATEPVHESTFVYVGADDQYFLGVVLPGDRNTRVTYDAATLPTEAGPRELVQFRTRVAGGLQDVSVYLGPKQVDLLKAVNHELVRAINFGIFGWLVVPLLQALNWINRFASNYGWSIILLTLAINGTIAPLRHKSVVSMRKMQEIQPQVKAIQDRYKDLKATDPARQKMNTELMNLYRERGVNPASGCLPLVLTMPVLFAFYSMLSQAIEIRGAPFMGWIQDLSTHDPYYVTPLLMGASMVLQQRMAPTTADPTQQRVMMFMPVLFTFMFLWAPSGLVIYWLVSNLWAIGQQYVTNRVIGPPKAIAVRPPAERRTKPAGA